MEITGSITFTEDEINEMCIERAATYIHIPNNMKLEASVRAYSYEVKVELVEKTVDERIY